MKSSDLSIIDLLDFSPDQGLVGLSNRRVMIFDGNIIMELRRMLVESLGWEQCKPVIFQYGYLVGRMDAENLDKLYDWQDREEWFKAGPIMQTQRGLAKSVLTAYDYDGENDKLRFSGKWYNSYEVDSHKHLNLTTEEPVCYVLCGYLSGYASNCFNREVLVLERQCLPDQSSCSFEGRFLEDWGETGIQLMQQAKNFDLRPKYEKIDRALAESYHSCKPSPSLKEVIRDHPTWLPYRSPSMAKVLDMAHKVAKTNANVLLTGGTGVGKEVIANYIHATSHRSRSKFLAINCTALPETLLESELFGHVKGSFTGAVRDKKGLLIEAGEGTIFLDEIGDVPPAIQVKLLRALQQRLVRPLGSNLELPIKARIVTSTNRDLKRLMLEGDFRQDLFYRLNVFPIRIPDLKDRKEDIVPIARYILSKCGPGSHGLSPKVIGVLEKYHWPGNVRELENILEYAVILAGEGKIQPEHLPPEILENNTPTDGESIQNDWPSMEELEKRYILQVLDYYKGQKNKAARLLGIGTNTLWRKLKKYDEPVSD